MYKERLVRHVGVIVIALSIAACEQKKEAASPSQTTPDTRQSAKAQSPPLATQQGPTAEKPFQEGAPTARQLEEAQSERVPRGRRFGQERFGQELSAPVPLQTMRVNETITLPIVVKNTSQETWKVSSDPAERHPVNLGYHWINGPTSKKPRENTEEPSASSFRRRRRVRHSPTGLLVTRGKVAVYNGIRTPLPHDLPPGESVALTATIQAPAQAGDFTLRLTMVREGVAWFEDRGGRPLDIPVTVIAQ